VDDLYRFESILHDLADSALSFILSNLLGLLFALFVAGLIFLLVVLGLKRSVTKKRLRKAIKLQQNQMTRLNALIAAEPFRGLGQGFVQGRTQRALADIENRLLALHRQAEPLQAELLACKVPFFSVFSPIMRVYRLYRDTKAWSNQVDSMAVEVNGIVNVEKSASSSVRQAAGHFSEVSAAIDRLCSESGYPLDELVRERQRIQALLDQTEQAAAFDVIQANTELNAFGRELNALQRRTDQMHKQLRIFGEMRSRVSREKEQLDRTRVELQSTDTNSIAIAMRQVDTILQRLEQSLRLGQDTDLRAGAVEVELLFKEAASRLQTARSRSE